MDPQLGPEKNLDKTGQNHITFKVMLYKMRSRYIMIIKVNYVDFYFEEDFTFYLFL